VNCSKSKDIGKLVKGKDLPQLTCPTVHGKFDYLCLQLVHDSSETVKEEHLLWTD